MVLPDFRTGVVRSASLRVEEAFLLVDDFRHVKIGELALSFATDQNVRTLDVSVHHFQVMERLEAAQALNHSRPELILSEASLSLEVSLDLVEHVS